MIIFLLAISIVVAVAAFTLFMMLNSEIKNVTSQLREINNTETNSKLLASETFKEFNKLCLAINENIKRKNDIEAKYKEMDLELRHAIANISHDLRTPLTSIIGYIQLIEKDNLTEEERKEYIEIVRKRSEALRMLIASFYDLSRLEAREYKFELTRINLSSIMCEIIASFYNDFLNKAIEPVLEIHENIAFINGDSNAVTRIISNLIHNMIKYAEKKVYISLKEDREFVITEFRNDAPNLTEEDAKHIFERFFTGDRTRNGSNTGLGLAITKQLVEQMGHCITGELTCGELVIEIRWRKSEKRTESVVKTENRF